MMTNNNEKSSNQDSMEEQKDQFRNFVEGVTGGGHGTGDDEAIQETSRVADKQNRLIDKHNLRK